MKDCWRIVSKVSWVHHLSPTHNPLRPTHLPHHLGLLCILVALPCALSLSLSFQQWWLKNRGRETSVRGRPADYHFSANTHFHGFRVTQQTHAHIYIWHICARNTHESLTLCWRPLFKHLQIRCSYVNVCLRKSQANPWVFNYAAGTGCSLSSVTQY